MGDLSVSEAFSGILGSISLASWIFVLVPQLAENYKAQNAQGISRAFLAIWLIGDLTNLIGATWAGLVPTVIALALYFCVADAVLILQCLYYDFICHRGISSASFAQTETSEDPRQPLLAQGSGACLPGPRRQSCASQTSDPLGSNSISLETPKKYRKTKKWVMNSASLMIVSIFGTSGWAIAWRTGLWLPASSGPVKSTTQTSLGAIILGYISAVCYLGARLPQIVKNYRGKSCQGLSPLFFMLSLLGNATYGGGIIFHSTEKEYLLVNLPWLIGSLGTMGEDILVFAQFRMYGDSKEL